jgi:ferritin-like protein
MAGSSGSFHEDAAQLSAETKDRHRAIVSIMEELEAVDWYDQRVEAATDEELSRILAHNRDEEKEHAAMLLEWLRRRDPGLNEQLRTYLFADEPILEIEGAAQTPDAPSAGMHSDGSLGIGTLKTENGS